MSSAENAGSIPSSRPARFEFKPLNSRWGRYASIALLASLLAAGIAHSNWGWSRFLNAWGVDACFEWRGAYSPQDVSEKLPQSKHIVIVELPHEVPRRVLARLIDQLRMAKVVGLDLMFSDREKDLSPEEKPFFKQEIVQWRRDNALFAAALARAKNVVIGSWADRTYVSQKNGSSKTVIAWTPGVASIERAARWRAHLSVVPDEQDNIVRRVLLWQNTEQFGVAAKEANSKQAIPAFGLSIAAAAQGKTPEAMAHDVALVGPQEMLIDYLGPRNCFESDTNRVMYDRVIEDFLPEDFKDQIVFVGETSYSSKDTFGTPFGDMPGLFIHANIAATLLSRAKAPGPMPFPLVVALAFLTSFSPLVPLLKRRSLWVCLPWTVLSALGAFGIMVLAWVGFHRVFPLSAPLLALFLTYNAVALYEYTRTRLMLWRVVGTQGTEQLLDALSEPELGGKLEVATAFFCDLRGYTTLSQHMPPQSLIGLLNLYTDSLVQEVTRFGGRPIDYFGDGVFVLFEGPGHAARGLRAALYAQEAVRNRFLDLQPLVENRPDWREAAKTPPQLGVAVHTGPMVIGLVGSRKRPKPGAVGDAVNVASRVQGLSTSVGMSVLLTRSTLEQLGEWDESEAKILPCGKHPVKGRDELVEVYGAVLAPERVVTAVRTQNGRPSRLRILNIFSSKT